MTCALSVHLQIDIIVIDPIAIVSLNLMAQQPETAHGPGTAPRSTPLRMAVFLFQILLFLTAIAAPCTILYGQPLQHHRRVHHGLFQAPGRYAPALITLAPPVSPRFHLRIELFTAPAKSEPCNHRCQPSTFFLIAPLTCYT